MRRAAPVGRDVAQRQPDGLLAASSPGKYPRVSTDLAQPRVDALDGMGRVDHLAHVRREREERIHHVQAPPGSHLVGQDSALTKLPASTTFARGLHLNEFVHCVESKNGCSQDSWLASHRLKPMVQRVLSDSAAQPHKHRKDAR